MARDNYDKEKNRIRMYNWRKNNPEKAKAAKHRRRMRKNTGRNDLSSDQIQAVFEETPFCSYCGCIKNLTLDHVKPLYRGGENTIDNILVCCGPCNSSKGTKTLWEFMDIS